MRILFIHQNFPGQFPHIARHLVKDPNHEVIAICQKQAPKLKDVPCITYKPARKVTKGIHHYLIGTEAAILNGQAVVRVLQGLQKKGFVPDVIIGHAAWGETLYCKDVFPMTKLINYTEFFYHAVGADTGFDPKYPNTFDDLTRIRSKNMINLLGLNNADQCISPTEWQKSVHPPEYHHKISVIHEGVNPDVVKPNPEAAFTLPNGQTLTKKDKVITYGIRNLEPYRGFHIFMHAVVEICKRQPDCQIVIFGGDGVSYGRKPTNGETYKQMLLEEVDIDESRVHFLGRLPHDQYLKVLQISAAHVYLTVPFVLSWSVIEAMAAECLIIASSTPPVKEVITHKKTGLLVDFFSVTEISDAVDHALAKPKTLQKLRKAARKFIVEHYTAKQSVQQYEALIGLNTDS